jgi:hypothetical protein
MIRRRASRYTLLAALLALGTPAAGAEDGTDADAEPVEAALPPPIGAALHPDAICPRLQALLAKDADSPEARKIAQTYQSLHCAARAAAAGARQPHPQQGAEAE